MILQQWWMESGYDDFTSVSSAGTKSKMASEKGMWEESCNVSISTDREFKDSMSGVADPHLGINDSCMESDIEDDTDSVSLLRSGDL